MTVVKLKLRRDTSANWASKNPILSAGEPGWDVSNKRLKIGDGSTAFNALSYFSIKEFSSGLNDQNDIITATLSTGKNGGQTVIGGNAAAENLILSSTVHDTKGKIIIGNSAYNENLNYLGLGTLFPQYGIDFRRDGLTALNAYSLIALINSTSATSGSKAQHSPGLLMQSASYRTANSTSYPAYWRLYSQASNAGDGVNSLNFQYSRDGSNFYNWAYISLPMGSGTPLFNCEVAVLGNNWEFSADISAYGTGNHAVNIKRSTSADTGYMMTLAAGQAKSMATNANGGELRLKSGASTGSGTSFISFYTQTAGASGTADRSTTEKVRIDGSGNIGVGILTPFSKIHLDGGGSSTYAQFTNTATGAASQEDGLLIGIDTNGTAEINQKENADIKVYVNNTHAYSFLADQSFELKNNKYLYFRSNLGSDSNNDFRIYPYQSFSIQKRVSGSYIDHIWFDGYRLQFRSTNEKLNNFIGFQTGNNALTGDYNSAYASESGQYLSTGSYNVLYGQSSGRLITSGSFNTAIGAYSLYNTAISGYRTGNYNTALGYQAGGGITSGSSNIAIGYAAMVSSQDYPLTGSYNIAIGFYAGKYVGGGYNNIFIGRESGSYNEEKSNSIFIGSYAGKYEDESNRIIIDVFDRYSTENQHDNAIIVGEMHESGSRYQYLTFNAKCFIRECLVLNPLDNDPGNQIGGMIWCKDNKLYFFDGTNKKEITLT